MSVSVVVNDGLGDITYRRDVVAAIGAASSIDIAVSYLQMSGWAILEGELEKIPAERIRILTTDQMNITHPAVLRKAMARGISVRCYRGTRVFHPKVYLLYGPTSTKHVAIVGSANVSSSGLETGIEAGIRLAEPHLFGRLASWFGHLFRHRSAKTVTEPFVNEYEKQWERAALTRVALRRIAVRRGANRATPTPEDVDTLDDLFSTIRLPIGTLGFDHAGNNIRNLARLLEVLSRYPQINAKERSELHLLGFVVDGELTPLGVKARQGETAEAVGRLWTSWIKATPDLELSELNPLLSSFKQAARRFWRLTEDVRAYFLREIANPDERETLQAIELSCSGSNVVESFSLDDFKEVAPFLASGKKMTKFIRDAITAYHNNKGSRSWTSDDRRIVLNAWHKADPGL